MRPVRSVALGTVLAAMLLACGAGGGGGSGSGGTITVGAVNFAENRIVAEMYALTLEEEGYEVDRQLNFESREQLQPALRAAEVDVAPEYLASLLTFLDPGSQPSSDPEDNADRLAGPLQERGLQLLHHSEADDTNAIVVTPRTATRYDLEEVSDLGAVDSRLTFGGPPECPQRRFCLQGLEDVYGLMFKEFKALDTGGPLTIAALASGQIDVALLFSTSGAIAARGWVLLLDDLDLQAADNITPVVRVEVMSDGMADALDRVSDSLTTRSITELNARVEVDGEPSSDVARDYLAEEDLL